MAAQERRQSSLAGSPVIKKLPGTFVDTIRIHTGRKWQWGRVHDLLPFAGDGSVQTSSGRVLGVSHFWLTQSYEATYHHR